MPPLDDIRDLEKQLDPAARALVSMMRAAFEELSKQLDDIKNQLKDQLAQNEKLRAQNEDLRRMLFGRKSEKIPPIASEVRRAIEADEYFGADGSSSGATSEDDEEQKKAREKERRKRGRKKSETERQKRRLAKKKLKVVHERVLVTPDQLPEGCSLEDFHEVGDGEVIRRVEHVKEHLVVVEYVLQTLASNDGDHIISAAAPPAVADGGHYGPGLYAHVVVSKCDDSLPLYRIEKAFAREGFTIPRSTLCSLFHRAAELLAPIADRLLELACQDSYLSADETRMPVQQKGGCRTGWIWTFLTDTIIAYVFSELREGKLPEALLGGTSGFLQIDAATIYDASLKENGRTRAGCWAHCRRMFFKALSGEPEEARKAMDFIVALYRIELEAADLDILGSEVHLELRRSKSAAIVDEFFELVEEQKPNHLPEGPMGKALSYASNQKETLKVFLTDPKIRLDNNLSENALRIMALGRKNFLFVGHDVAGSNLATLQTVIATCRLHGVNPYDYIRDMLLRVQTHPASRIDELLPFNWQPSSSQSPPAPS